jgi:processing peptidase subunit beta
MVCDSTINEAEFEALKEELNNEHESNHQRYKETTIENAHFNAYRDHMLGQPAKGDRDNLQCLTTDMLRDFHTTNYFGDNIVVVATGNANHQEVCDAVEQQFSNLPKHTTNQIKNQDKAVFTPSLMFVRDDEMVNSNVSVFYDAPSAKHADFYAFLLLKNMFGTYSIDKNAEHLNDCKKQYNSMHSLLGDLVDVTIGESMYYAYSDSGMFGNYFYGNEVFTRQMNYCGVCLPTMYSHYLNDVEVIRGRNSMYNKMMNDTESTSRVLNEIGNQMLTVGRRISRSEIAKRVSHLDNIHMRHLCNSWFYDAEPCFTNWGPVEAVSCVGSYKYFKINTLATVSNAHHSLFN